MAGLLAQSINLPGIVGAFLAGLAVNAAVKIKNKPAKEKLEFFGNSFFIPIFFAVTGFLINPVAFFQSITTNFLLASGVIAALLVGKWIAAQIVGRGYARDDMVTHVASGGGDTCGYVSRIRRSKSRRSTTAR